MSGRLAIQLLCLFIQSAVNLFSYCCIQLPLCPDALLFSHLAIQLFKRSVSLLFSYLAAPLSDDLFV